MSQPTRNENADPTSRPDPAPQPSSLDPADWDEFRRLFHELADTAIDYLQHTRERPVWSKPPSCAKEKLLEKVPAESSSLGSVCGEFVEDILPYATGNTHPRFCGWVHGGGTPGGVLAEMLAATMNSNVGGREHVAVYVERQVLEWARQLFSLPETTSGILLSGTSMANLTALAVARNRRAGYDVRKEGLAAARSPQVAYASSEVHESVVKALELLGLGRKSLRTIPVGDDFRMSLDGLRAAIRKDKAEGFLPFCVVGGAGTVNTGAVDDLAALADVCEEHDLWLHVDGAFGALGVMTPSLKPKLSGIERADSLAFDFHKWMHVPYDAGCCLIRDGAAHRDTFLSRRPYLTSMARGLAAGDVWFCDYGIELSRGFRALKVWFALREHGVRRLGRMIEANCVLAGRLAEAVRASPELELMAPVPLNIVCFRYTGAIRDPERLDRLNADIVADLQESGLAAPSTTVLGGSTVIRACISNHRTEEGDIDALLEGVVRCGRQRAESDGGRRGPSGSSAT